MTQRKKTVYRRAAGVTGSDAPTISARQRQRRGRSYSSRESRRGITYAILGVGVMIALWAVVAAFSGPGTGASPSRSATDAKALEAAVTPLLDRLRQNPSDQAAMIELGNRYYDASRWDDAIPWYEKALAAVPANTDVRTDLGTAYFYSGNSDKAKEQWTKVLEQEPNKVQTHYNLGVLYSHGDSPDMEAAAKEWETVIRIAPNSEQAQSAEKQLKALGKR